MKNPSLKNFFLREIHNNNKTKGKNTMILRAREIAHVNILACVPARARVIARISGNNVL